MMCRSLDLSHRALCAANAQRYYSGDDWSVRLAFTDADGEAIDLTGMAFRATIRGQVTVARSSEDSTQIEILDQEDATTKGRIRLRVGRGEAIPPGQYAIDVVRIADDGSEQTWGAGIFEAKKRHTPSPIV